MKTCFFNSTIDPIEGEILIANASNGEVKANPEYLQVTQDSYTFIYTYGAGWAQVNPKTKVMIDLPQGASPTAEYEDLAVFDTDIWNAITYKQEQGTVEE